MQVTTTPTEGWRSFKWADPQLVTFKARDGVDVFARLYTPEMMGASAIRRVRASCSFMAPVTCRTRTVTGPATSASMFHNLLAARGYVVLDVDPRELGLRARLADRHLQAHGRKRSRGHRRRCKYLVSAERVDPKRIGVYGGSYGGFITLMAMFTTPDVFAAGAALRPVTDWAHYNHGYVEHPQRAAQGRRAYRRSSPSISPRT